MQIAKNAVQLAPGATVTVSPDSASGRCPGGYLCLFWNINWGGNQLTLGPHDGCAFYDLSQFYDSSGKTWANQASSIDNPLPRPGTAYFYHGPTFVYSLAAGHYLKDLTKNTAANGHNLNDYIDNLFTC